VTEGDISDLDEDDFRKLAEQAKATCAVSRALGGLKQITVSPRLATYARIGQ
jgi:organic hydroperoxide reductase OsmC/OhrA